MTNHPITPPPELVQQWAKDRALLGDDTSLHLYIANRAAQYGADQELEACCEWLRSQYHSEAWVDQLLAIRRPKPPSLKEQALADLHEIYISQPFPIGDSRFKSIRTALESIND